MIELRQITKKYPESKEDEITALKGIDLILPETGLVIINGTSGCGKTTLLNIIGGLDRPTSGEVYVDGTRVDNKNEKWWDEFRGAYLGFIYQEFNLLENMSVRENVELPLNVYNIDENSKKTRVNEVLTALGLNEYSTKKTAKLSGGQKQRVAIARAIVTGAKIILADEPTGNLDKENSENVFKLLKDIAKNRLVIVVTHDSMLARVYADRLIQVAYGTIEDDIKVSNEFIEKDINKFENEDIHSYQKTIDTCKNGLPLKECLKYAIQAMQKRKLRCFISFLIFSITILFMLVLCEAIYRDDSIPITNLVNDKNQKIIPLYREVSNEYINLVEDEKIVIGKKLYDLICDCANENRLIRCDLSCDVQFQSDSYMETQRMFVSEGNEKYFAYEGKMPQKENEMAISKMLADKLGEENDVLGTTAFIDEVEYTITGIVTHICEKNIENIYLDNGSEENVFKNMIFCSVQELEKIDKQSSIYMSGLGMTYYDNLFYQATVYNDIFAIDNETELICGSMPTKDNEILVSESLLEQREQVPNDVLGKSYSLRNLYEKKYDGSYWNKINLRDYIGDSISIVGITKGNGDYYVTPSLFDELYRLYMNYYQYPYYLLVDKETFKEDVYKLHEEEVKIDDSEVEKIYNLIENIDSVKMPMIIVVGIIALLSVLQMISLYSYSINDSKKTIGVLRTIGVNKADTKKIFTVECAIISTLSFVCAICLNFAVTSLINNYLNENVLHIFEINFLNMRISILIITGIAIIALSVMSVLIPVIKYSRMKIIELIK